MGEFTKLVHKEKANENILDMFHKVEYVVASLTLVFLGALITRTCKRLPPPLLLLTLLLEWTS